MTGCALLATLYLTKRLYNIKKKYASIVTQAIDHSAFIRILVESKYENVKVIGLANLDNYKLASHYRTKNVHLDAKIYKQYRGIELTINGHSISAFALTWY